MKIALQQIGCGAPTKPISVPWQHPRIVPHPVAVDKPANRPLTSACTTRPTLQETALRHLQAARQSAPSAVTVTPVAGP